MGGRFSRRAFLVGGAAAVGAARPARALSLVPTEPVFTSGVASGDPSDHGVVLWTRVDPDAHHGGDVSWEVFPRDEPGNVLASGSEVVDGDRDGTVSVAVDGLPDGTALAFRFVAAGAVAEGVTRTLPSRPRSLRIGVVSCSKYSDGYYGAYRALAGMGCDLVLHLGDYVYASRSGATSDPLRRWDTVRGREHRPDRETTTLADYRERYRQYRADPDLQLLHRSVPVVAVWDDNDIANNAWAGGNAQGEPPESWLPRKRAGQQVWSEYHPTRVDAPDADGNLAIWRRIRAGGLLDLFMLDTRLQRTQQVTNAAAASTPANDEPIDVRAILGEPQRRWLLKHLGRSESAWRMLGQGVVMTHWRVVGPPERIGALRRELPLVRDVGSNGGVYWNSDGWDGYTAERDVLFDAFASTGAVLVLTGDVHSSWANELVPGADPLNDPVGVELVAPAVSTRPFASNVGGATPPFEAAFTAANPWIKFCDMDANGFLVVDLDEDRAVGRWFQVNAQDPTSAASPLAAWVTDRETRRLLPHLG